MPESNKIYISEDMQVGLPNTMYEFIRCNSKEHTYFLNNMICSKVLNLFKNLIEKVEQKEISSMNEGQVFDRNDEQHYFLQLIQESDLKDISVYMTNGFLLTNIIDFNTTVIKIAAIPIIKKLIDLSFSEFISIYQLIQSQAKDCSIILSDACPQYFYWRGL